MLIDGLQLLEGSSASNLTVASGTAFPSLPSIGELFYRTDTDTLYVSDGATWSTISATVDFDSFNVKTAVVAASTANITLGGLQTVDGVSLAIGNRVLVKNQSTPSQNGIYIVANAGWTRATDFDAVPAGEVKTGDFMFVQQGTTQGSTGWVLSTSGTIQVGTTALAFAQFTGTNVSPGGASGTIQFNNAGTFDGASGFSVDGTTGSLTYYVGDKSSPADSVLTGAGSTGSTAARFRVAGGETQTGAGGIAELAGGTAFSSGGSGGAANVGGGSSNIGNGNGGSVSISGGAVNGTGSGGTVSISGGSATSGTPGSIALRTNNLQRFRVTPTGALSIGTTSTAYGTSGQILTSAGDAAPSWAAPAPAAAGTLTGTTLASNVLASSLTSVGTLGSLTITGNATAADPTVGTHLATKQYVDTVASGLTPHPSVKAATIANITLSGTQTIDGVSLSVGQRVLAKNQSVGSQNGVYLVASSAWTRAADFDGSPSTEVQSGDFVFVESGTVNGGNGWVLVTLGAITVGTTALAFSQVTSSAGGVTSVQASGGSTGLSFSGGPITTTGTLTLAGILALASGGTGATTQAGAAIAVLPSQAAASGQFLTSDGTNVSWTASGATLTSLNASNLSTGTVNTARLGGGTADSTTFLRGDNSWAVPSISVLPNATTFGTTAAAVTLTGIASNGASPMTIAAGASTSSAPNSLTVSAGAAAGANAGGALVLKGGTDAASGGTTGSVTIHADGNLGQGGAVIVRGGDTSQNAGAAGALTLRGGDSTNGATSGIPGAVTIRAGNAINTQAGGAVTISAGTSSAGGGALVFNTASTSTLTERLRITNTGAWSVGTGGSAYGTAGQILTSAGNAPPTWATPASPSSVQLAQGLYTSVSTAVTTTSTTAVDTFATGTFRSAKYQATIADGTSYETVEFLLIHNGTTVYMTTYGNVFTSAATLGGFDASIASGTLTLTYTAVAATSKTVKLIRTTTNV